MEAGVSTSGGAAVAAPPAKNGNAQPEAISIEELKAQALLLGNGSLDNAELAQSWADFYAKLEGADIPSLAAALASTKDDKLDSGLRAVYSTWAQTDPAAAWRSALSFSEGGRCNGAMHAVLDTVGKKDPSRALAMAQAIEVESLREHMNSSALATLAKSDPSRALAVALKSAERGDTSAFYSVLTEWVANDAAGAQRAVASLRGRLGEQARSAIVQGLVENDPEAAWKYAAQLPPTADRYSWDPRTQVIERWSQTDPRKALEAALTIGDAEIRNRAIAQGVGNWASSDFQAALAYAGSLKDSGLRGHVLEALAGNQNADPSTMFGVLLDQAPAGDTFRNALSNLMSRWAQSNPREAAAATLQVPTGEALTAAASSLAQEWASSAADKNEVLAWAARLPRGRARSQALESVFESWSAFDAAGAQRAWTALAPEDKEQVLSSLTSGWSRARPSEAARWAANLVDQPGGRDALRRAVFAWTQSAPMEAASFLQSLPESERSGLASELIGQWYQMDPFAAADWLKRQPLGPARDEGVAALAMRIAAENPQMALSWAKSIANAQSRETEEKNILQQWMMNDAAAAAAWIRTSQLSEETKAELLRVGR